MDGLPFPAKLSIIEGKKVPREGSMLAVLYFLLFAGCGVGIVTWLLPKKTPVVRVWLGLALGVALEMWLPALCAFFFTFSLAAHGAALGLLALLTWLAWVFRDPSPRAGWTARDRRLAVLLCAVALPLTVIGGILQFTHNLLPGDNGALYTGQSTYGDLHLHLAIASSLRNAAFPPDYSIMPGELLAYPFLTDSLSTSFMLMGFSLRASIVFPGIWMMGLTFSGYVLLAARMADSKKGAVLAVLFFFLNGGLGFLYMVDMQGKVLGSANSNSLQSAAGLLDRIRLVLNEYYWTPANHWEFGTYNLRWSNVIVDMMVPQRTTLGGWTQVIPCVYLLYDALRPENGAAALPPADGPTAVRRRKTVSWQQTALLGVWAGMLPMINTHCFLALGLMSAGWLVWDAIKSRKQIGACVAFWAVYGALAAGLALPQMLTWTFRQTVGNQDFLNLHFNWVNNTGSDLSNIHLQDGYLWFYIKNIGLPFVLLLLSLLEKNEKRRFMASGAFVIFLAAELIQFQPNPYDNNKLFYIWYMLCAVLAADYALELLDRLKGLRARPVIAVLAAVMCFASGTLAVAREINSPSTMRRYAPPYNGEAVAAAAFVEENIPQHAVFMTANDSFNFVSSLAGRTIVCGPDLWLRYHGFDTDLRKEDISNFYKDPAAGSGILEKYGVDYILVREAECAMASDQWEWMSYAQRQQMLDELNGQMSRLFPLIYSSDSGGIRIYAVEAQTE